MKAKDIRQNNNAQIEKLIKENNDKLKGLHFGSAGSREKNVKLHKTIKKDIARMMTVLNEPKAINN